MTPTADGCGKLGKNVRVDVVVKVRPLSGYWVANNPDTSVVAMRKDSGSSNSGIALSSAHNVVHKDEKKLKCIWERDGREESSDFVSSGPPTPPKPSTPLRPYNLTPGWKKGTINKKRTFWEKKKGADSQKSSGSQCRYKAKRRRFKWKSPKKNPLWSENKMQTVKETSPTKDIFFSPIKDIPKEIAKKSVEEVTKVAENLGNSTDEGHFWELKYWIILMVFWLTILIYRFVALSEKKTKIRP